MNSLLTNPECMQKPLECTEKPKPSVPSVYLDTEQTKALFGKDTPKVGEKYESEFQFTVKSWEAGQHGVRATLELTDCSSCEGAMEEDDGEAEKDARK